MTDQAIVNNPISRILLLLSIAFIFAYCFGVVFHEIGHVLAYLYYGIPTDVFVIHPFGRNYMEPNMEVEQGGLLFVYSGGALFNVICAVSFSFLVWKRKNLMIFPFLMWGGSSLIQEAVAIILDLTNGGKFDWAIVVSTGVPIEMVIGLVVLFLVSGSMYFLRLMALIGVNKNDSYSKVLMISLGGIVPFFLLSLIYVSIYQEALVFSKSIALASSIVLSILLSSIFRPSYDFLDKIISIKTATIELRHMSFSLVLALLIVFVGLFYFN